MYDVFNANVYCDSMDDERWHIRNIPKTFALRIDLVYLTGTDFVIIYDEMPSSNERMELMWKLQRGAREGQYSILVTDAQGTIDAPAI